jgi:hypothetical protein
MPTDITYNGLTATIPALGDTANIVTAFDSYHVDISAAVPKLTVANTFTQNNTFSGDIAVNGGDITSTASTLNIGQPSSTTTTVTLNLGPATPSSGVTKTINIGTNASTGSTNIVNIGPASGTLTSTINLNGKPKLYNQGLLSTIEAGILEYDGNIFYATPKVNNTTYGRGLVTTPYVFIESADLTLTQSSAVSTGLGGTSTDSDTSTIFGKQIYLAANSTYLVDALIMLSHNVQTTTFGSGTVTSSATFGFNTPSGSTVNFDILSNIDIATLNTSGTPASQIYNSGVISIKSVTAPTDDTGFSIFRIRGTIRTSATAGLFGPVANTAVSVFNDTPAENNAQSQCTTKANSYLIVTPAGGTTADVAIGGWA